MLQCLVHHSTHHCRLPHPSIPYVVGVWRGIRLLLLSHPDPIMLLSTKQQNHVALVLRWKGFAALSGKLVPASTGRANSSLAAELGLATQLNGCLLAAKAALCVASLVKVQQHTKHTETTQKLHSRVPPPGCDLCVWQSHRQRVSCAR